MSKQCINIQAKLQDLITSISAYSNYPQLNFYDTPLPQFKNSPGPEVIKLFSSSTQLSTTFQLPIKTKILTNEEITGFKSLRCCIYHANKCLNAKNCGYFNIYEQDKFRAQLS